MHIADTGLYAAKQAGRDRVTVGESDPAGERSGEPALIAVPEPDGEVALRLAGRDERPSIHQAVDEEDPQPNGREIR